MNKLCSVLVFILISSVVLVSNLYAAEAICEDFQLQGDNLLVSEESMSIVNIVESYKADSDSSIVAIDFANSQLCINEDIGADAASLSNSADYRINSGFDELVIRSLIDGSIDAWLRLDVAYAGELMLTREIGEQTGLTDMEFLSDNSGVGAEDFFSEQILFLQLGGIEIDAPFADIPRFGVEYSHYAESAISETDQKSTGSLGMGILKNTRLYFDRSTLKVWIE